MEDKAERTHEAVAKPHLKSAGRDMVGNSSSYMVEDSGFGDVVYSRQLHVASSEVG